MAPKKAVLTIAMIAVFLVMAAVSGQANPASAQTATGTPTAAATQPSDDFPVMMTVTGVIKSVIQQSPSVLRLVLDDGTEILVNPATQGLSQYKVGDTVEIYGSLEDDLLVAKTAKAGAAPTATAPANATLQPTLAPTLAPTLPATPASTQAASCGSGNTHPVATKLADAFGVSYDEVMGLHCQGNGFGNIARAYLLAQKSKDGLTAKDLLDKHKSGTGWGNIVKEVGANPKDLAPGAVISGKKNPLATATAGATTSGSTAKDKGNSDKNDKNDKGNSGGASLGQSGGLGNSGNGGGNAGGNSGGKGNDNNGKGGGKGKP